MKRNEAKRLILQEWDDWAAKKTRTDGNLAQPNHLATKLFR